MSLPFDFMPPEEGFLGLPFDEVPKPQKARAWIIPFGLEATVSYEGGAAHGPAAMIAASQQVELFDDAFWREPVRDWGVATVVAPKIPNELEPALDRLTEMVWATVEAGKFPMVFGGEHAITPAAVRAIANRHDDLLVLQFDAHADLRDGYHGARFSHAAAMRRCLDLPNVSILGVGIRNISAEEIDDYEKYRKKKRLKIYWAREKALWSIEKIKKRLSGKKIYITFDVDAFDASLMPATGTPEPGGLFWDDVMPILEAAAEVGAIIGADVNELAPRPGLHACDFTAAKLAYRILSYALR